jgi:molybdenum cofactor guanylyltransferase
MEVGVYILAGGKSERMGEDKAQIKIGDKCMIEYVLDVAKKINAHPIIISSNESHEKFGTCIPDAVLNQGPAMGVYTALRHTDHDYNLILSCDMPLIDLKICQFGDLISSNDILCYGNDFLYPFPGLYAKRILYKWKEQLDAGERKVQRMIKCFDYKEMPVENLDLFLNVNAKDELVRASKKLER